MSIETSVPPVAGDIVERPFLRLSWQKGIPSETGINGCRVEDVLDVAGEKLRAYQSGPLACDENAEALQAIELAIEALQARRQRRQDQGVLNTMNAHETERTEDLDEDFSATGA